MGTARKKLLINRGETASPEAQEASGLLLPRLLDLKCTGAYLSISPWTVRDLEAAGILTRVRLPVPNHGELRKILFDRSDLDRLVDMWKNTFAAT